VAGTLYAGTSGFAYPAWSPRFYPAGTRAQALLPAYAARLKACELNNTFYQQPTETKVAAWLAATPPSFRFSVKAQRGGSFRSFAVDPAASIPWLTRPLAWFGPRLGTVLFRVPESQQRDDERLAAFLRAWPANIPLTMEFQHDSWAVDEVFDALRSAGAVACATELPDDLEPPPITLTGSFLYLRLRRHDYEPAEIETWADRLTPFLESGIDAFVFFRHDEVGRAPELALALDAAVAARVPA
jgi:uncharacterized protein YecE (DUF72 family)